jgi:hypothetical protein
LSWFLLKTSLLYVEEAVHSIVAPIARDEARCGVGECVLDAVNELTADSKVLRL